MFPQPIMDFINRLTLTSALPWNSPLVPLVSVERPDKLPLYGPLNIADYSKFLHDTKRVFNDCYCAKLSNRVALTDFKFLRTIAQGGFGKLILVEGKDENKTLYAMKTFIKTFLIQKDCVTNVLHEKTILESFECPFCVRLEYFCQTDSHLFLFLPFVSGGDLFTHLRKSGKFKENLSKFYAAQVVLALEALHYCDIIHRDIKPENILIDHFGFIKISDFGFAKVITSRTYTFCGTIEYAAPEVILGKGHGKPVDWWSFGILLFEMSSGKSPFSDSDELKMCKKIIQTDYSMPEFFSIELKDLVRGLLVRNPTARAGNSLQGAKEVKSHSWFKGIDWLELLNRKVLPPFIPVNSARYNKINFPYLSTNIPQLSFSPPPENDEPFKDF